MNSEKRDDMNKDFDRQVCWPAFCLRKVIRGAGWLSAFLSAAELWILVGLVAIFFLVNLCVERCQGDSGCCGGAEVCPYFCGPTQPPNRSQKAFEKLFNVSEAKTGIVSMLIFFMTWLVGGGVLVSVLIKRYYCLEFGDYRCWTWFLKRHIIVLGWEDGLLAEVASEAKEARRECLVITQRDAREIRAKLAAAGVSEVTVYRGAYDDETEWKRRLKVERANCVYIAGEKDEVAHDAKVQMVGAALLEACTKTDTERNKLELKERIRVFIHDFGLAHSLMSLEQEGNGRNSQKNWSCINFHTNWADRLWDDLLKDSKGQIELFVVGLGAMGKAVVLSVNRKLGGQGRLVIHVTDDDQGKLDDEWVRFRKEFAKELNCPDGIVKIGPEDWQSVLWQLSRIEDGLQGRSQRVIVVVAKKQAEKGYRCMAEVIRRMSEYVDVDTRFTFALNQEIAWHALSGKADGEQDALRDLEICAESGKRIKVRIFGFATGCLSGDKRRAIGELNSFRPRQTQSAIPQKV